MLCVHAACVNACGRSKEVLRSWDEHILKEVVLPEDIRAQVARRMLLGTCIHVCVF